MFSILRKQEMILYSLKVYQQEFCHTVENTSLHIHVWSVTERMLLVVLNIRSRTSMHISIHVCRTIWCPFSEKKYAKRTIAKLHVTLTLTFASKFFRYLQKTFRWFDTIPSLLLRALLLFLPNCDYSFA
jgi:hypothetical protein